MRLFSSQLLLAGLLIGLCLVSGCDLQGESEPQPREPDSSYVNSIGIRFQRVPAGTFQMGSARGQDDERPVHEVKISEPFYVSAHEVTQLQWDILMDENPSYFEGPHRPVDSVSWHRVQDFIERLNQKEDTDLYRLPTEAEWEYAARGGSDARFHFGDGRDSLSSHAWYSLNSDRRSHRVGQKGNNRFGLYDMHGNVWEWTRDRYSPQFYERSRRVDPVNEAEGVRVPYVIRGGGWYSVVADLRSANRAWARSDSRDPQLGFRLVREIPDDAE